MTDTITIVGNVATEPRQTTPGGVPITSFRVAASQRHFDRANNVWVEGHTNWYTVSVFRVLGEHALESLHKGDRVFVRGRLRIRDWTAGDKSGTTAEIDADALGHDLQWGTTTFTKAGFRENGHMHPGASIGEGSEQWRAPMGESASGEQSLSSPRSVDDVPADEMAMAIAGRAPAETPF